MIWVVNILGILLIIFIVWFFFGKQDEEVEVRERIDILVDGGYKPKNIRIKKGQRTIISFLRKDSNSCLEEIIIPDFKIKKYLPLGEKVTIELTPKLEGEFQFQCGMNMFHGKVVVK